jgi:predicted O-methyltransferase YrrM
MENQRKIIPDGYENILKETNTVGFDQSSDPLLGSLLSTLSATKPNGNFLELGTGSGLSTAWLLQGMDAGSFLVTVEKDKDLIAIAKKHLGQDPRVIFVTGEGEQLILNTPSGSIDFIFADTWPGKYNHLEETLALLKSGGIYLIDDMLPQDNWPQGHDEKAAALISYLEQRDDFLMTRLSWSTGIIICTKRA